MSTTFGVTGKEVAGLSALEAFEDAQLPPLAQLAVFLGEEVSKKTGGRNCDLPYYQAVTTDGDSVMESYVGTINFYLNPGVGMDVVRAYQKYFDKWERAGFKFRFGNRVEQSGAVKRRSDDVPYNVWRVEVVENPLEGNEAIENLASINLAVVNANVVLDILRFASGRMARLFANNVHGTVPIGTASNAVDEVIEKRLWEGKRRETHRHYDKVGDELKLRMVEFGLDESRIKRYFDRLKVLLDEGKKQGYTEFYWG